MSFLVSSEQLMDLLHTATNTNMFVPRQHKVKHMAAFRFGVIDDIFIDPVKVNAFSVGHDINEYTGWAVSMVEKSGNKVQVKGGFKYELDAIDYATLLATEFGVDYEDPYSC